MLLHVRFGALWIVFSVVACDASRPGSGGGDGSGSSTTTKYQGSFSLIPQTQPPYSEVNVLATLQMGNASCGGYSATIALTGGTGPTLGCGTLQGSSLSFATVGAFVVNRTYRPATGSGNLTSTDLDLDLTGIDPESFTATFHGTLQP